MKISLIHPSRSRPEKALKTSTEWLEKAGCECEYILSLDEDDPKLEEYFNTNKGSKVLGNNTCVVEATNAAAKVSTGDILLYLSDDFRCFDNWGLAVLKEFEGESRPLLLKVDDCLQKFHVPVLTIPIMNRELYNKLGYFWHPEYKSMFVDEDLYWTSHKIGAIKNAEHLKFPHEHPCVGKAQDDETYRRSAANWDQGKKLFAYRKSLGFPVWAV